MLAQDRHNKSCLDIVDNALFVVCLDDTAPESLADLCSNFLCGTYDLKDGEQVGTCTNRWYDKVSEVSLACYINVLTVLCMIHSSKSLSARTEQLGSILNILVWMGTPF